MILAGGDDEPAALGVGKDLRVGHRAGGAGADLIAIKLLDHRGETFCLGDAADFDEARLQRRGLARAGLQLGDDVAGDLQVAGRTAHHDALAAGVVADAGGGGGASVGRATGERLRQDGGKVRRVGGARAEYLGKLNGLRAQRDVRDARLAVDVFIDAIDEQLDLLQLAGNGRSDDETVQGGIGNDARLGSGGGTRLVRGGHAWYGLANDVGEFIGLDGLWEVNPHIATGTVLLLELVDHLLRQRDALARTEEHERARGVVIDSGDVIVRVGRQHVHRLRVRVERGALGRGGKAEGAVEQVAHDGSAGVQQRVSLHLLVHGDLGVDGREQCADAADVAEAIRDDEAAPA